MLLAIHAEALFEMLVSKPVDIFNSPFSHSRIALTVNILDEYEAKFASTVSGKMMYQSFMQAISDRFKSVDPQFASLGCTIADDYFSASRSGGRYLALAAGQAPCAASKGILSKIGVRAGPFPTLFESTANSGYKPFESHYLVHGKRNSPDAIGRFFREESRITVYDKYINEASLDLINYAMSLASDACSLVVITSSAGGAMSLRQIRRAIVLRGKQSATVDAADNTTIALIHDRHIFVSSDVELHLTRGADCFGRSPAWVNEAAAVHVYDTSIGSDVTIKFKRDSSGASRRPIKVKSCVIRGSDS